MSATCNKGLGAMGFPFFLHIDLKIKDFYEYMSRLNFMSTEISQITSISHLVLNVNYIFLMQKFTSYL